MLSSGVNSIAERRGRDGFDEHHGGRLERQSRRAHFIRRGRVRDDGRRLDQSQQSVVRAPVENGVLTGGTAGHEGRSHPAQHGAEEGAIKMGRVTQEDQHLPAGRDAGPPVGVLEGPTTGFEVAP